MKNLGLAVRKKREEQKISQVDLAVRLGVNPSTICRWERGKRTPRSKAILRGLLKFLSEKKAIPEEVLDGEPKQGA